MDQHLAHLVPVMALVLENISQMWTLLSNHYFSCFQKNPRKPGPRSSFVLLRDDLSKTSCWIRRLPEKPQIIKADEIQF